MKLESETDSKQAKLEIEARSIHSDFNTENRQDCWTSRPGQDYSTVRLETASRIDLCLVGLDIEDQLVGIPNNQTPFIYLFFLLSSLYKKYYTK